ncbi:DUF6352 family protein [Azospirillum halopraeferens]|uniref:DUF6352 family protein n=1 Tax=Azospirillum halopraeferens TaxID=34010 RepID=UPI0004207341|nr:DUF6352 family protein [Azospirillum halopraeferens]
MPDFWSESGYHLLRRDADGRLAVTDDFLRAYLARPEMAPVAESCAAERALHARLMEAPSRPVSEAEVSAPADPDAVANWRVWLAFRDRLLAGGTLEAAYLALFREGARGVPGLFLDQLVHAILRGILEGTPSALRVRAGELLFRTQIASVEGGRVRLADAETVEMHAATGGFGSLGRLVTEAGMAPRSVELDVLDERTQEEYWARAGRHDTVLDITFGAAGLDALSRVLESWVAHFLAVRVSIQPVQTIRDERWVWHVGLDAEGSAILNDLYRGQPVEEERLARILSLFRLEFADPAAMRADIAGRPVYLALAMDADRRVRLKPQNLLVNLPLAAVS